MRIVLIRPVYRTDRYDPEIQEPLGLEALAGFLRYHGHKALILDPMLTGQSEDVTIKRAAAFFPDIAGFSLMSRGDLESANRMIEGIKKLVPGIRIVAGGNLVTTEPEKACDGLPEETACILYEGETPVMAFVDAIERGKSIDTVPSMILRKRDGSIIRTEDALPVGNLDELPFAARDLSRRLTEMNLAVNIEGSRGCNGACRYCCTPAFPRGGKPGWRGRSPERIADEIGSIVKQTGARFFNFVDDNFPGPESVAEDRAAAFLEALSRLRLRIAFGIQARASSLSPETVRRLAGAGMCYVYIGIENIDENVLKGWGKNQDISLVESAINSLRALDIEVQAGHIPFHGDATVESVKKQAMFLSRMDLLNLRTATNRLQMLPGSQMYREAAARGDIGSEASGPYLERIKDAHTEMLYDALVSALEPVMPVWRHAASMLPSAIAAVRLSSPSGAENCDKRAGALREALGLLDRHVGDALFRLIESIESTGHCGQLRTDILKRSHEISVSAARILAGAGLVESLEYMLEVIRKD